MIEQVHFLFPELILAGFALLVLVGELIFRHGTRISAVAFHHKLGYLALLGLTLSLAVTIQQCTGPTSDVLFSRLVVVDPLTQFFRCLVLVAGGLVLVLTQHFEGIPEGRKGPFYALLLLATMAMMMMASSNDLLMLFLTIEFLGIASYVLVGFAKHQLPSSEGAVKYFLVGAFSSAIMLYGMTLLYGLARSTNLYDVAAWYRGSVAGGSSEPLLTAAVFLVLVGFGFKVALVPFHMWVPDVYQGAPTPITAYLAVASKAAGMAVLLRVFLIALPAPVGVLVVLSAVTMTLGNLMAIPQKNLKRLLAYSSIGHVGYLMMGFVASQEALRASGTFTRLGEGVQANFGLQGILVYLIAYLLMNIGAFAVVIAISNRTGGEDMEHYSGLSRRDPGLAYVLTVFLLSLAGVPPTIGFLAKFYVIGAALQSGFHVLAVIAVINSVIALYYYFRVVHQMFFVAPPQDEPARPVSPGLVLVLGGTAILVLGIGLFPETISELVRVPLIWLN